MYFDGKIRVMVTSAATGRTSQLYTVHSVKMKDDSKNIGSSCKIVVPLACRIQYQGPDSNGDYLTDLTKNLFKSGDGITVTCWYDGMPEVQVFAGFVYEFIEGTPMTIVCMDNVYLLNQTTVNISYPSISLRDLLLKILEGTGVGLIQPTLDLQLQNITFRIMSPASILQWFRTELGLNISLQGNQLYCNIASNVVATAKLDTRINVIQSNLQKPEAVYLKLKVKAWFIQENGKKSSIEVGDTNGELREVFFYKIPFDSLKYQKLAGEALIKYKQMKFSGHVHTLLYPAIPLFTKVSFTAFRYPDQTGNYTVVAREFDAIPEHGYHWNYDMAYLSDIDSSVDQLAIDNSIINSNPS